MSKITKEERPALFATLVNTCFEMQEYSITRTAQKKLSELYNMPFPELCAYHKKLSENLYGEL